jgi:acyl dehydratase
MLQPRLRMNLLRMVHGEMDVEWRAPIRPGDRLQLSMDIADIEDTPAGELLRLAGEARRDGALLVRAVAGLLVRGRGGEQRSGAAAEEAAAERFRRELVTEDGQQLEYARASADRNFIHTSRLLARLAGLPRTIMHGMCILAMSAAGLVDELADGDPARLMQLRGRFSRPAIPGWRLSLVGYGAADCDPIPFAVFGPAGEPVIKRGRVTIGRPAAAATATAE